MCDVILSYLHEDSISELFILLDKYSYRADFMKEVRAHVFCISAKLLEVMTQTTVTSDETMSFLTFFYRILTNSYAKDVTFTQVLALGDSEEAVAESNKKSKKDGTIGPIYPKDFREIFRRKIDREFTCYDAYLELENGYPKPDSTYPNFLFDFASDYLHEENYEEWFYIVISTLHAKDRSFVSMKLSILHHFIEEFEIRGYVTKKFQEVCFSWTKISSKVNNKLCIPLSTFIRDFVSLPRDILIKKYQIPSYYHLQGKKQ